MSSGSGPTGRLFIAAQLPANIRDTLADYATRLEKAFAGRYVPAANYHVTLAFLGNTRLSAVLELDQVLREAAQDFEPIPVKLDKPGRFGKAYSAIVWAGLTNSDLLTRLAKRVRRGLDAHGFTYDPKPANPHITLARNVDTAGRTLPALPEAAGEISSTALFLSTRREGSLVYLPEVAVSLG